MTTTSANGTSTKQPRSANINSVEECKTFLINTIQQLRKDNQIGKSEEVSLYVTDVPLVHSTIAEYEGDIKRSANLVDIVQVNVKAGNPMPAALPHVDCEIGEDEVTIALER